MMIGIFGAWTAAAAAAAAGLVELALGRMGPWATTSCLLPISVSVLLLTLLFVPLSLLLVFGSGELAYLGWGEPGAQCSLKGGLSLLRDG